jgi:hypothetical protein
MTVPWLSIAAVVRPHHANTFVEEWFRLSRAAGALWEAFDETHLMTWPDNAGEGGKESPEEQRYHDIEDEILERILQALIPAITEAFMQTASEVLERERRANGHRASD